MIVCLKNHEIDREKWDYCIKNSPGVKPYAYSWYLDIMAPGWQALVDDDYDSVFPLPGKSRYGIQYAATPIFLQQLGAFSRDKPASDVIKGFLDYIPEYYKLIDLCIDQKLDDPGYKVTEKVNFELDLSKPYEKLWNGFTSDCRRNIQIGAKMNIELTNDASPEEMTVLFKSNKGILIKGIKTTDYDRLERLMDYCKNSNKGKIIGVRDIHKKLIFGIFLVLFQGSITLLFTVNTTESRDKRVGYFVINEIIKEAALSENVLDFAGSSIPSIASFMKSFGSVRVPYYRVYRNKLPWPVSMMK